MTKALSTSGEGDERKPVKQILAERLKSDSRIARFKGATIIESKGKWVDMNSDKFAEACYGLFGVGLTKSRIADLEHFFRTSAQDMSEMAPYISFGDKVWDMKKLDWTEKVTAADCIYRVTNEPLEDYSAMDFMLKGRLKFIMSLACNDPKVYDDIMQSVAPILMHKKPTGVIWYLGGGANGKSTLVHLIYKIFGPYLTELTVKQLEDERDTPQLNGKLANVCKESSEGFVEDTRTYKSIGTHENFSVHKFHSQDMVEIEGNVHHIFSANNIPTFGDKSYGARRRTLVIPFNNHYQNDESFEKKTFTPQFVDAFIAEMIKYAQILRDKQDYRYKFSPTTTNMKEKYDTEANTAQTYADELVSTDILGFDNFRLLHTDYENWAEENGYRPSSINILRRAIDEKGFSRKSARNEAGQPIKMYMVDEASSNDLIRVHGRLGLYQIKNSEVNVSKLNENEQEDLLGDWSKKDEKKDNNGSTFDGF